MGCQNLILEEPLRASDIADLLRELQVDQAKLDKPMSAETRAAIERFLKVEHQELDDIRPPPSAAPPASGS